MEPSSTVVVIGWITLALTAGGAVFGIVRYANKEIEQERIWREAADDEERKAREAVAMNDNMGRQVLMQMINDMKLEMAKTYVSKDNLAATENRLTASLEKVASRLETIVLRLDRLTVNLLRQAGAVIGDEHQG